jgi:hypothetical protein
MDVYLNSEFRLNLRCAVWTTDNQPPRVNSLRDPRNVSLAKTVHFRRTLSQALARMSAELSLLFCHQSS